MSAPRLTRYTDAMAGFYYADGEKVRLEAEDTLVALNRAGAERAGFGKQIAGALAAARRLPGGVHLTERALLTADVLSSLREAGAIQPVYRHGRALLVPMPEVRIEFAAAQRGAVLDALAHPPSPVAVEEQSDGRIVLRVNSGNGDDAIEVANYVYEQARPAMSAARLIQVVSRPGADRPGGRGR